MEARSAPTVSVKEMEAAQWMAWVSEAARSDDAEPDRPRPGCCRSPSTVTTRSRVACGSVPSLPCRARKRGRASMQSMRVDGGVPRFDRTRHTMRGQGVHRSRCSRTTLPM